MLLCLTQPLLEKDPRVSSVLLSIVAAGKGQEYIQGGGAQFATWERAQHCLAPALS